MSVINKLENAATLFVGQGDLVIFDKIDDYENANLASLVNPRSLGQIVQDSTSWDGEDVSVDQIKDEQGNMITAKTTAGTLAFSFEIASTSQDMIIKFLNGVSISPSAVAGFQTPTKITGFGTDMPVISAPIAIINDVEDRAWLYPKAKISSNLSYSDGLWRIKASVIAETVDAPTLKTGMILEAVVDKGE